MIPMTELKEPAEVDFDTLMAFVFRAVDEVGAALNVGLVVMGDKLGYYRAMAASGPVTPSRLAADTGTTEPYAREWLNGQAAGAFVEYDASSGEYTLPLEHAAAFTDESSPAFLPGLFQIALGTLQDASKVIELARSGAGYGWHEHNHDVHEGCERFFRPGYEAHLVAEWLPALDGVVAKLETGARVADIGCGYGASTILMAEAFPNSTFIGYDYHADSIHEARARAQAAGVTGRVRFDVATADAFPGTGYDLVTTFDALHDMGDPVGAAAHVNRSLAADGTWMIVEPMAGDHVEDNLNPVGRAYYGFSTLLCTPASLSQEGGLALGTQAGPARIREVVAKGGLTRFAKVAETPFNQVLEVRH
jgi:SAM-dependent methyltransferase